MKEKELVKFVEWLEQSGESPKDASFDETISWINELATSSEGQQILDRLIKTYKNKEMGIFKEGGKLNYLLCLKKGGNIQDCGCGKKIEKNQPGGEISRRDALNMLRTTGSSNSESRKEYRDAKRDARESGLRGEEMRQAARNAAMARGIDRIIPALDNTVEIIDRPIEDRLEVLPTISGMAVSNSPRGIITTPRAQERPEILTFQGDFNTAFSNARKMGEDRFYWNGKEYTTELADPNKLAIQTAPSADDSFVEKYIPANHNPGGMPAATYDAIYTLGANLRKRKRK